jgi:hypothetical protein
MHQPPTIDSLISAQKELLAFAYNSAAAYTNLILGAGYVGYFATWAFLKDRLTPLTELWSALLVLVSLLSFILFEVYKSFYVSQSLLSLQRAVQDPAHFLQRVQEYERDRQARDIRMGRIWATTFWFCLLTGFAGGLIFISAVVHAIFLRYQGS